MKKLVLLLTLAFGIKTMTAQTYDGSTPTAQGMNDIMIDPIFLIAAPAANITYERLLNQDAGLGINAIFGLGRDMENVWQISPFYRMYFGKKFASGFFVEGFVPITYSKSESYWVNNQPQTYEATTVGIGVGFGGKWVVKRNIVFEASSGIGRRFGNTENLDSVITGKGMLGIGYRF